VRRIEQERAVMRAIKRFDPYGLLTSGKVWTSRAARNDQRDTFVVD